MSAPRKIWATEYDEAGAKGAGHWIDHNFSVDAVAYHHDDVVRELERELQAALAYFDHHGITGGERWNNPRRPRQDRTA